jgi:Protein of unknown function, DUF
MTKVQSLDDKKNHQAMIALMSYSPMAAVLLTAPTRFERMALELQFAIQNTNNVELGKLLALLASDIGSALMRRVIGILTLAGKLLSGTAQELEGLLKAFSADNLVNHLKRRVGTATEITTGALSNGAKSLSTLYRELLTNPSDAAPKLLVLALVSIAASGGVDGDGGLPDSDIPLMGIGAHRSPFTHSIIIGSLLEAALRLLMRIVITSHKNLPVNHDPLWDGIASQSVNILNAAGKGASIGIAYHLMIDAVVQPDAYHGLPFDMPIEAHQMLTAINSTSEAIAVEEYPDEEVLTATAEERAAHKKLLATHFFISPVLCELFSKADVIVLNKNGTWLQALAKGTIRPTTIPQVQFIKVCAGRSAPTTPHEKTWISFLNAKRKIGWTTAI